MFSAVGKFTIALLATAALLFTSPNLAQAANRAAVTMAPGAVTVEGVRSVGQTLTAQTTGWSAPSVSFKYQWLRNGAVISGATRSTYTVTAKDSAGGEVIDQYTPTKNITVKVTATAPGYKTATATSASVLASNGKACTMIGTAFRDIIFGTTGVDILCGLGGDDVFAYSKGADFIDGGDGSDGFDMSDQSANATVNLALGTATVKGGKINTLLSIENVGTGRGSDVIHGSNADNRIVTYTLDAPSDGNDQVLSSGGDDVIFTGPGDDYIAAGAGDDSVIAGEGDDLIFGGTDFDFCDLPDSYEDQQDSCDPTAQAPTLLEITTPEHGVGHYEVVVVDPFSSVVGLSIGFQKPDGTPSLGGSEEAYFISRSGLTSTWGYDFDLLGISPALLEPGRHGLRITTQTIDGRWSELVGRADGIWEAYTGEFEGDPEDSPFWVAEENIGSTFVEFNWDITPPVVSGLTLSSQTVDTSSASQTITAHIIATDDQSTQFTAVCELVVFDSALRLEPISGNAEFEGSGDCSLDIPQGLPAMSFGVRVSVADEIGNFFTINPTGNNKYSSISARAGNLFGLALNPSVTVADIAYTQSVSAEFIQNGSGDSISPDLTSIVWSSNSISTTASAVTVRATLTYAGITGSNSRVSCRLTNALGKIGMIPAQMTDPAVDGNTWVATFTIPKKAPKGSYVLFCAAQDQIKWTSTFQGRSNGTFVTTGVNAVNPAVNPGVPYLLVQ